LSVVSQRILRGCTAGGVLLGLAGCVSKVGESNTVRDRTDGIWISAAELADRPMSGPSWDALKEAADAPLKAEPNLSAREGEGLQVMARALVYARTGIEGYRSEVVEAVMAAMGTEGGDALATFRSLGTYVIAADLVGLPPAEDAVFRAWLETLLDPTHLVGSRSLVGGHEDRPNNWGTMAGGSRAAIAAYLDDEQELARTAVVFQGWLGDRASYAGFEYGNLAWQCDPGAPVGINPSGCTREGHSIDGVLPDDQRRSDQADGGFTWPPPRENYVYEALSGALAQAYLLHRAGYDVWNWQDRALLRAYRWLHDQAEFPAVGDDQWQPWLVNHVYGSDFPVVAPAQPGKIVGWTDWTHATGVQSASRQPLDTRARR
jgi:hypothetical protein